MTHYLKITFIAVFFVLASFHPVKAQTITITEQTQLNFTILEKPASGSKNITINATTNGVSGTGTVLIGTPTRGQYSVKCTGAGCNPSATIDINNINSGNANLTISNFTGDYDGSALASFPQSGLAKPTGGGKTLYLGATATYNSSVPVGTLTPSFDIVVTIP